MAETVRVIPFARTNGPIVKPPVFGAIVVLAVITVFVVRIELLDVVIYEPDGIDTATFEAPVIRPSAPTVIAGMLEALPYVPAVTPLGGTALITVLNPKCLTDTFELAAGAEVKMSVVPVTE